MIIQPASITNAQELTDLTKKSKAYWGYSATQIEFWNEELTITPHYIAETETFVLINGQDILGYYSFVEISPEMVKLDNMFLLPSEIGKGFGRLLMVDFLERLKTRGYTHVKLDAEPGAQKFYEKFGFEVVDKLHSSIIGRFLPVMEYHFQTL